MICQTWYHSYIFDRSLTSIYRNAKKWLEFGEFVSPTVPSHHPHLCLIGPDVRLRQLLTYLAQVRLVDTVSTTGVKVAKVLQCTSTVYNLLLNRCRHGNQRQMNLRNLSVGLQQKGPHQALAIGTDRQWLIRFGSCKSGMRSSRSSLLLQHWISLSLLQFRRWTNEDQCSQGSGWLCALCHILPRSWGPNGLWSMVSCWFYESCKTMPTLLL